MIREWNNPYNSFNSLKGLLYKDHYLAIKEWKEGKIKKPLPPIEISIDLFRGCQNKCVGCNASRYLLKNNIVKMPDKHLMNLIKFFGKWKTKWKGRTYKVLALCFGGGGESTLHTKLPDALLLSKKLNLENGIATNGINFYERLIEVSLHTCRWIGISVDCASNKMYKKLKGTEFFNKVIENIEKLNKYKRKHNLDCDIAYKFLVYPFNVKEIFKACKLAKDLGCSTFYARPIDLFHQGVDNKYKKTKFYNKKIITQALKEFDKCHKLEDKDFLVITSIHKYDKNFRPWKDFEQCYAAPINLQVCPKELFFCVDQRYNDFYKLGNHYPNPKNILKVWGNKKHYDLVFNTGKKNCVSRCTWTHYNYQCELFIKNKDPMFWKFT